MNFEQLIDTFQNHPLSDKRRQAADDLISNKMYNDISIKAFSNGLLDNDIGIRDICVRALLDTPDEYKAVAASAVAPYINMREIELRNLSGEILTHLGADSVPVLLPYLKSADFDVRKFACDILGLVGNESIVPYIIPLLNDPDKNTLLSSIETLGNLHAGSALDALIMVYENFEAVKTFDEVKPFVIEAIGKIGGENSESYLLEQLKKEKDRFLQSAIIDALSFNTMNISVSYQLLEIMPSVSSVELQKIMLMTAFAIAFRLEENLIMPDNLRYVSYIGMKENDLNIMTASLISLGNSYRMEDIQPLLGVIARDVDPDLQKQVLFTLTVNSFDDVILSFFENYFVWEISNEVNTSFLDNIDIFWDAISEENKNAIINALLFSFEQNSSQKQLENLDLLISLDKPLVITALKKHLHETSEENKRIIEEFLAIHNN